MRGHNSTARFQYLSGVVTPNERLLSDLASAAARAAKAAEELVGLASQLL